MNLKLSDELQLQIDKLKNLENMYDSLRLVDPVNKSVFANQGDAACALEGRCFDIWQKGKACENCISMRAYNDNQTYVKIEYNSQRIFMVTAMPVKLRDRTIVLELLKDATKSIFVENAELNNTVEIHTLIEQLNLAALKDGLTDVYNRRFINERLPVDILETVVNDGELTAIICDLDHFKKINDKYGHLAGDQVIKRFAKILEYCIRKTDDWVARYGGEEFLICLKHTDADGAASVAERMRKTLQEELFILSGDRVQITASFGLACLSELAEASPEAIIECADKKLYLAKQNGRNRVEK